MRTKAGFPSIVPINNKTRVVIGGLTLAIAFASPILRSSDALAQVAAHTVSTNKGSSSRATQAKPGRFTALYNFTGGVDGGVPTAGLIMDTSGDLYGTTEYGGDLNCNPPDGCGTVFKLDPVGKETVLYSFTDGADGAVPVGDLLLDKNGDIYGTAYYGGNGNCDAGCGTVFEINPHGNETTLYQFQGQGSGDGENPKAGLVMDGAGRLYGTTEYGGNTGGGTVFEVNKTGSATVLHSFQYAPDGAVPQSKLVLDGAGNLYGTTFFGGTGSCGSGCGTVFKVDGKTDAEKVVYSFTGGSDGSFPQAGLARDKSGELFGTASQAGNNASNNGTIFSINSAGTLTVLYNFPNEALNGGTPEASMVLDKRGNLYGTTWIGGYADVGVVFKLSSNGKEKRLHSFLGGKDGGYPVSDVMLDAAGNVYGTTPQYGTYGAGTVFRILRKSGAVR